MEGTAMECIDLAERFGDRLRMGRDPSYRAEYGPRGRTDDPWTLTIPCRHGHICPWGGDLLAACTSRRGPVALRLMTLDCITVVQDGSDGVNATFHVRDFDRVAAVMVPKRRRVLSPERRKQMAEYSRKFGFRPKRMANADSEARIRTQTGLGDQSIGQST